MREPRWALLYRTAYTRAVGARLRRLREVREMTQREARLRANRPNGQPYSQSTLARLEAGYANAPLYAYIHFASAYETDPARLLGLDEIERKVSSAEMALVKVLRRLGISPDRAIAALIERDG